MKKILLLLTVIMALSSFSVWADETSVTNVDGISSATDDVLSGSSVFNDVATDGKATDDVIPDDTANDNIIADTVITDEVVDLTSLPPDFNISDWRNTEYLNNTQWKGHFDSIYEADDYIEYTVYFYVDGKPWAKGDVAKIHSEDKVDLPLTVGPADGNNNCYGWFNSPLPPVFLNGDYWTPAYNNITTDITSDTCFYGFTCPNAYPVFIAMNDGTNNFFDEKIYATESGIVQVPSSTPTSVGRQFKGYSRDRAGSQIIDIKNADSLKLSGATVVYCQWNLIEYDVNYYMNDGTDSIFETKKGNVAIGAELPSSNPTRVGFTFEGWYTDSTCNHQFNSGNPITSETNVYAKWVKSKGYNVKFYMNDGTNTIFKTVTGSETGTPNPGTPTREGYTFNGWWNKNYDYEINFSTPVTSEQEWYADWNIIYYPVNLYMNDGTNDIYWTANGGSGATINGFTATQLYGGSHPDPTRSGYTFGGWYYDKQCSREFVSNTPVKQALDLYAKWIFQGSPKLSISKSVDKQSARSSDTLTYTITVTNSGTAVAKNVVVEDVLASNLVFEHATDGIFTNNKFSWAIPEIEKDSFVSVDIVTKIK